MRRFEPVAAALSVCLSAGACGVGTPPSPPSPSHAEKSGAPGASITSAPIPGGVRIRDLTGLVERQEAGLSVPAGLTVADIIVQPAATGADALDVFWIAVPCQPEATITLEGDRREVALHVQPEPPLKRDCELEGVIHGTRLFFSVPVDQMTVIPTIAALTVPED